MADDACVGCRCSRRRRRGWTRPSRSPSPPRSSRPWTRSRRNRSSPQRLRATASAAARAVDRRAPRRTPHRTRASPSRAPGPTAHVRPSSPAFDRSLRIADRCVVVVVRRPRLLHGLGSLRGLEPPPPSQHAAHAKRARDGRHRTDLRVRVWLRLPRHLRGGTPCLGCLCCA